jgi:hypothetical protein
MLYAAIDIHKHAFQAAVLDSESGEVVEERFAADRDSLARWAEQCRDRGGGDRGDDRLALGLARAGRPRVWPNVGSVSRSSRGRPMTA